MDALEFIKKTDQNHLKRAKEQPFETIGTVFGRVAQAGGNEERSAESGHALCPRGLGREVQTGPGKL